MGKSDKEAEKKERVRKGKMCKKKVKETPKCKEKERER